MKSALESYKALYAELSQQPNPRLSEKEQGYDKDLTIAIRLMEQGHSALDIAKAIRTASPMLADYQNDPRGQNIYLNRIRENINAAFWQKSQTAASTVQDSYKKERDALQNAYTKEGRTRSYGLAEDSEIAVTLLTRGFSRENILTAIRRHTPAHDADASYFAVLETGLLQTQTRYQEIRDFHKERLTSPADAYRRYAKTYMAATKTRRLTDFDEQRIAEALYRDITNGKPIQDDAMESFLPFLRQGVLYASPVYTEPGRDSDRYIQSVLENFKSNYYAERSKAQETLPGVAKKLSQRVRTLKEEVQDYINLHGDAFLDGVAAKELLQQGESQEHITASLFHNNLPNFQNRETALTYAKTIFDSAQRSLHMEKEVEAIPLLPKQGSVRSKDEVLKLYRQILKERTLRNPGFLFELTEPYADRDAAEEILNRFKGIDTGVLKEAIMEGSPRANLPGIPPDYADQVLSQAQGRLRRALTYQKQQTEREKNFNRLRGLSTGGVYGEEDTPMSRLKDGRVTCKMLRQGMNEDDIRRYLLALANPKGDGITPEQRQYADQILLTSKNVLIREQTIVQFLSPQDKPTCRSQYLQTMQRAYQSKGFFQASMDVAACKTLKQAKFSLKEIRLTIAQNSPVAIEPGRDEGYLDYVNSQADQEILRDKEREQNYVVLPRLTTKADGKRIPCPEELHYQRQKMQEDLKLLPTPAGDAKIARALLNSGYSERELEDALDAEPLQSETHSEQGEEVHYGERILKTVREYMQEEVQGRGKDKVKVRTRTTVTTTESTET